MLCVFPWAFGLPSTAAAQGNQPMISELRAVTFALMQKYVPEFRAMPGTVIRANAFKCGDDCEEPHFGTLFPIDPRKVPEPAFHVPQYFGEWRIL